MKCFLWMFSFMLIAMLLLCGVAVLVSPAVLDSSTGQWLVGSWPGDLYIFVSMLVGYLIFLKRNPVD